MLFRRRCTWCICLVALQLAWFARSSQAVEPAQDFLDALLARGYYDIAIDYLDYAKNSNAVPVAFKKTYFYQRGKAMMEGARSQRDPALREKQLNEASQTFSQFLQEQPDNLLAIDCRSQLGNVIVERARMQLEKAKKADDKAAIHTAARKLYEDALKIFTDLEKEVAEQLERFPKVMDEKRDKEKIERRDQFRKDYLQAQLLVAATKEEAAATFDAKTPEYKKYLEEASKLYAEIYEKYRTRLAGLYARLYQARCEQKMGKHKEAMSFLTNDIFSQPDQPDPFRTLKIKGTVLGMESWAALNQNAEAISKAMAFIDTARPIETKTSEFMELRLSAAKAMAAYMEELKKKNPGDKEIRRLKTEGNKLLTTILRTPNEYQDDARPLLPIFSGGAAEATARQEPKDFNEAKQLGREAIVAMQTAGSTAKAMQSQLATAKSPEKEEMAKQLEATQKAEATARADALYYFTLAQRMVTKDVADEDVSLVLYLTCFLKYMEEDYMAAVVLGEFVAERYPASAGARQCAKIALASYLKLYGEQEKDADKSFESEHIVGIADYIVKKWPEQPEAEEALNTLIPFMIQNRELDRAQAYLDKIPEKSVHRGSAELKTGQALWANYLTTASEMRKWETGEVKPPEGVDPEKVKADLEQLKSRAQKTLVDGVARMQKGGEITPTVATAALSLSQIFVDTNQPSKAVELLEDPKIGPLVLLDKKNPVMMRPGIPEETYKTALRAYISALATAKDSSTTVEKAKGIMEKLKSTVGATEDGQKKLVVTYVGIARDLQTQMVNSAPDVRVALGKGFEAFLDQVAQDANELNVLNWVGETYRGMAESFVVKKDSIPPEAKMYFGKANQTFERILKKGEADKNFLPGEMATQVRLSLAKTYRQAGDYVKALDLFESILKERALLLPIQQEAAYTYQELGDAHARLGTPEGTKNAIANYRNAMIGARPDSSNPDKLKRKKNIIWGWGEMARLTASNPKFSDAFHEARVNLSKARYKMAMLMTDKERHAQLEQVKADVRITLGLYPTLGGDKWRSQYDEVLKEAQIALKEKPIGLAELEKPEVKTTATSAKAPMP